VFLPLGDYPNPRKPQWITRILLGANVAIFLFVSLPLSGQPLTEADWQDPDNRAAFEALAERSRTDYDRLRFDEQVRAAWLRSIDKYTLFTQKYGYKPGAPTLVSLLFCMFLHGGFLHLAGNMLYLWIFGDNVEARLGPVGYIAAYLVTGVFATLAFSFTDMESMVPLVGASGAISGVLGFYFRWFPNNQIRVLVLFIFIMFVHVRAVWILGFYVLIDNLLPFLAQQHAPGAGGVAYGAHLGGFIAGLGGAFLFNAIKGTPPRTKPDAYRRVRTVRWTDPRMRERLQSAMEDPSATFSAAMRDLRMEDAAHAFSRLVREGGLPPEPQHVFHLARWLYDNDFVADAAAVFRYYIRSYPRGDDLDRVHLGLGILLGRRLGQPTPAREHLHAAIDTARAGSNIARLARDELSRLEE